MALVAHIDSGKTTLTESILLRSEYLSSSGSVDTGSTTTDFLPVERERGITIQSASIPVRWKHWTFNLIDTPGHADFGMEVESASRVVDGAVVLIDSVEGVEAQTLGVWKQLDRYNVATRIMFLNKMDRPGASFKSSFRSLLSNRLHPNPLSLVVPVASFDPQHYEQGEPSIQGLVDLVAWELWKWDQNGKSSCTPLPRKAEELNSLPYLSSSHPVVPHLLEARVQFLENLSMFSNDLMQKLLDLPPEPSSYLSIKTSDIIPHLRRATLLNEVLPVMCGSAMKNVGTDLLMNYVGELLASPLDGLNDVKEENSSLRMLAWKVTWDKRRGWMTFVRIYSGTLTPQMTILNTTRNQRERVSKLLLLFASDAQEVTELPFGSVGVILGLLYTRTGDTLVSHDAPLAIRSALRDITPPSAVISASIIPLSYSDLEPVQQALANLSRTDPSVRYDTQEGQLLIHGLGTLHLEIVEGRLRDEWNARFEFGRRRVSYREGLDRGAIAPCWTLWESDLGDKRGSLRLPLRVRSLESDEEGDPVWDGNVVVNKKGRALHLKEGERNSPLMYILEGISSALSSSPHSSLAFSRIHIEVNMSALKLKSDLNPSFLTGATATALRKMFVAVGMGPIMEPYSFLKVTVNETSMGKAVKDITENGGEVQDLFDGSACGLDENTGYSEAGIYIPPGWLSPSGMDNKSSSICHGSQLKRTIHAIVPLSKFLDYSNRLRALSEGNGLFEMTNSSFREVSDTRKMDILREIGRA